jgi:hypothetical protein
LPRKARDAINTWEIYSKTALSRISRITLAVLVGLIALFLMARLRYAGKAPVKLQAENCDPDLWKHVIDKERLPVVEECTAVEGRVVSLHRASDGDLHIGLDPEHKSVLNLINVMHARGKLVVEIICEHTPVEAGDKVTCGSFHPQVAIPNVGDRVRVTGAYVTDRDNGWNEVHPVTRIEILR